MLLSAALLLVSSLQTKKPPVWTEQKLIDGVTISAPVLLKERHSNDLKPGERCWQAIVSFVDIDIKIRRLDKALPTDVSITFDKFILSMSPGKHGQVVGMRDLLLQGWPGLAITAKSNQGVFVVSRAFETNELEVNLTATYGTRLRPPVVDRYLDSLHLPSSGTRTTPGPIMSRFPLDEVGVSLILPGKPERKETVVSQHTPLVSYVSAYNARTFAIQYLDLMARDLIAIKGLSLEQQLSEMLQAFASEPAAKLVKKQILKIGTQTAMSAEFAFADADETEAEVLVFVRDKRVFYVQISYPKVYKDAAATKTFLDSIELLPETVTWIEQTPAPGLTLTTPVKLTLLPSQPSATAYPEAKKVTVDSWIATKGGTTFFVMTTKLGSEEKTPGTNRLTDMVAGYYKAVKGTLKSEVDILHDGWRGISALIDIANGGTMEAQFFDAGDKAVAVACIYQPNEKHPQDVERFFQSIHFSPGGKSTDAPPELTRFPMGHSGFTILLPCAPRYQETDFGPNELDKVGHMYEALYCFRDYRAAWIDIPASQVASLTAEKIKAMEKTFSEHALSMLPVKIAKQSEDHFGQETGLLTEFVGQTSEKVDGKGKLLVYVHGSKMIVLLVASPVAYDDPIITDRFLHSVESTN